MRTAMVIESSPVHRELLEVFLETMGYSYVWSYADGSTAREAYGGQYPRPSIIIVDHDLVDGDGLRLARDLVAMDETVRIVFLSTDPAAERESYEAGATEFIKKPFSLVEIGRAVNRAQRPGVVS
jgi:DNA-binding response OmpR family regulator